MAFDECSIRICHLCKHLTVAMHLIILLGHTTHYTVNPDTEKEMQLHRWLGLDVEMVDQDSQS